MDKITLGIICGVAFGVIDILIMIPLKYESKRKKVEAISAAFLERFMIGFLIPNIDLGISPIITGAILGIALSVPSAIITRVYGPIVGIGLVGGIIIGYATKAVAG
jgi:hypothetical protein